MRITVFGKGNVGGGLADLWERAGHQVTRLGRDGGSVSDADVVLVAVPGGSIAEAFDRLTVAQARTASSSVISQLARSATRLQARRLQHRRTAHAA
jgi:predicted dinucleotide-binding enzyme